MSDNTSSTSNEINKVLNLEENRNVLKRKCELPPDNPFEKKKKVLKASTLVLDKLEILSNQNNNVANHIIENTNSRNERLKTKVEKLPVNSLSRNQISRSTKSLSSPQLNPISKAKFSEGMTKSLNSNINKIIIKEKTLENNLKSHNSIINEGKHKILNEQVKKNLNLLEIEFLKLQLEDFKNINKDKKKNTSDKIAQMMADRETWNINLEKSSKVIEEIKKKKMQLHSLNLVRELEIKKETENHEILQEKEKEISNMKTNISFDILKIEEEIKIIERKQKLLNIELEKFLMKKNEYYKNKFEALSQLLILKPFYKKFCIIRNYKQKERDIGNNINLTNVVTGLNLSHTNLKLSLYNNISQSESGQYNNINSSYPFKIDKSRKLLTILDQGEESKIKMDYICSLFDNPYEEVNYCVESQFINDELVQMLMSYLIKMNSLNDERDFIILYLSDQLELEKVDGKINLLFNKNLMIIVHDIINKISHYNDYTIFMKIGTKEEFYELLKESNFGDTKKFNFNNKEIDKNLISIFNSVDESEIKVTCIYFCIKNKKNNSKMKFFYFDYKSKLLVENLLTKFNEINISKRKKERSSKKSKKGLQDVYQILNEMEFTTSFFFSSIVDMPVDEFNSKNLSNIKELLLSI